MAAHWQAVPWMAVHLTAVQLMAGHMFFAVHFLLLIVVLLPLDLSGTHSVYYCFGALAPGLLQAVSQLHEHHLSVGRLPCLHGKLTATG